MTEKSKRINNSSLSLVLEKTNTNKKNHNKNKIATSFSIIKKINQFFYILRLIYKQDKNKKI